MSERDHWKSNLLMLIIAGLLALATAGPIVVLVAALS
jgi:hypothetical protein